MAAVALQAIALFGGLDVFYVFFAQNYFQQYERVANYLDTQDTKSPPLPWATETVWPDKQSDESLQGVVEPITEITTTVSTTQTTSKTTSTTKSHSETRSSRSTTKSHGETWSSQSTGAIETLTADNIVDIELTDEVEGNFTALPSDLPNCNFPYLHMGGSLLRSPYNFSANVDIEMWEPAMQQLNEVRRLINVRKKSLRKYRAEQINDLLSDLDRLVDKPLRIGCSVLQHLQGKLIELTRTQVGGRSISERRTLLAELLRETELQLVHAIRQTSSQGHKPRSLPYWALSAPELRSEKCPDRECFRLGTTSLEAFTRTIPRRLLGEVLKLKADARYDSWHITKLLFSWLYGFWVEILRRIGQHTFLVAILILFLTFLLRFFVSNIWGLELRNLGTSDRPIARPAAGGEVG
ncbi:hypothetical protein GGR58DRAFT_485937 [Xylaria digitata]|nr:hypothetical protein GGR58DRAFT_485937 [Xylaria digitata]